MFHLRNAARDYEGHLSGTDCRGSWYPIAQLVLLALMSSSCPSPSILEELMLGLSRRKYREAVREFREAYGLEKSAISEHIEAGRQRSTRDRWLPRIGCTENDSMQPVRPLSILQGFAFHNAKAFDQMNLGAAVSRLSVSIL